MNSLMKKICGSDLILVSPFIRVQAHLNIRKRMKSYGFGDGKKSGNLLSKTTSIDHITFTLYTKL